MTEKIGAPAGTGAAGRGKRPGFLPLEEEGQHFTLERDPCPNLYFTFPICGNPVR